MYEDIDVVIAKNGVAYIRIDRPDRNNAVRAETMEEICEALDAASEDDAVKVIVLGATGRHFVTGADFEFLEDLRDMAAAEVKGRIYKYFQGAARRLYNCPKPTVAVVQGAAITVGCELALACDFRIASERAMFQESWIRLGLMPPLGGLFLLPHIVGLGKAKDMVLRGVAVQAEEALELGLIHELVEESELEEAGSKFALELAALPPIAYQAVKEGLHRGLDSTMGREWDANVNMQSLLIGSKDFAEGLSAVRVKRKPEFTGK